MAADRRAPRAAPEQITADAVVLAVPARPQAGCWRGVPGASAAAAALGGIEYASMAIVTLAYPRSRFPAIRDAWPRGRPRSGYLVPAVEKRAVKAVTFSHREVAAPAGGAADAAEPVDLIRCSIGRIGEEGVLQRDDRELAALAAADLADGAGAQGAPLDARVTRWGGGLPQYTVGHLDRVAAIRAGVAAQPGLAVCGAAYDGIGIPACIATARTAADAARWPVRPRHIQGRAEPGPAQSPARAQPARRMPGPAMADNGSMAANDEGGRPEGEAARLKARDLNELIRYTMWSVFRVSDRAALDGGGGGPGPGPERVADEVTGLLEEAAGQGHRHPRLLRRAGPARRRRLHVLVDRAVRR